MLSELSGGMWQHVMDIALGFFWIALYYVVVALESFLTGWARCQPT